jgi:hypothetical protein
MLDDDQGDDLPGRDGDHGNKFTGQDEDHAIDLPTGMIIIDNFK